MIAQPYITCVGEVLIDFFATRSPASLSAARAFALHPGGAAGNVCVGISKLGVRAAFVGCVGRDAFGRYLRGELSKYGVDVSGLRQVDGYKTRLAFVSVTRSGNRDFEFWENVPADTRLRLEPPAMARLSRSAIIHFSSFLLLREPSRSTALRASRALHNAGKIISFDPNLRLSLWTSRRKARDLHSRMIEHCDILRLNEEEARFFSGERSASIAAARFHRMGPQVVVVTHGAAGCTVSTPHGSAELPAYRVKAVDTTGCGDAFLAGLLSGVVLEGKALDAITLPAWRTICRRANAAGALTATRQGGMRALPDVRALKKFLEGENS